MFNSEVLTVYHNNELIQMHRCLLVAELVRHITESCAPGYKDTTAGQEFPCVGLATVCALVQTCRALQGPALDVIWYQQLGLDHLVKCIPDHAWEMYRAETGRWSDDGRMRMVDISTAPLKGTAR